MDKFDNNFRLPEDHSPSISAVVAFIVSLLGFVVVGPMMRFILDLLFYDGSIMKFFEEFTDPSASPKFKLPLFIIQGSAALIGLFVIPAVYMYAREKISIQSFFVKPLGITPFLIAGIVTVTFMTVNAVFIEWNLNVSFPEFMKGFENWARQTEEAAAKMTEYLTAFDSFSQFMVAFFVVAVFAALGEELVFRGIMQNMIYKANGNIHIAIWLSAVLFSAIHFQFFGFVPRVLLGALFGYLYYWSGNLWIPIFAHFINNGFTLVMIYLYNLGQVNFDIENSEPPSLMAVVLFAIITAGLLFYFRNHFLKNNPDEQMAEGV